MMAMQNGITESMTTGMTRPAKHSLVLLFTILLSIFMCQGLYLLKSAEAASLNKTYIFATTSESWAGNGGTGTTDAYQSGAGNPAGALQSRIYGKNQTNANAGWLLTGITWESLGVPAGSTITSVDGYYDWSCSEFTTGNTASASGNLVITDSADGNATTLETGLTFSAITSWATRNATVTVAMPAALQASNTSIKIKLLGNLQTGNSTTAAVARQMDNIVLVITYAAADSTPPTTSGLTFESPVSGTYVGSPFNFHGDLTDNESNVTACQYCVKNGSECISTDTWVAGTLSGSSPLWTCTASNVSTYSNGGAITSGDAVYIDVRGTSSGGQNANGGTAITKTMDKLGPNSGASFTATPGNTTCTLNWASTTDAGSGMHATEPYEVRQQLDSDPGSCSGGGQLYIGTALTAPHNGLANGSTYYYRLCYKDVLLNQSGYSGIFITCVPVSGPPTLNPEAPITGTWTNEAGGALTPDKINDESNLTYATTATALATFNTAFSNDAAYSGKQIDKVRIYIRAYTTTDEFIDWGPVIGGTPYLSTAVVTLTTIITDYYKDWNVNPQSGVNWTPAEVDALEAQIQATKNGGGGMGGERVYKVWAEITFSEPVASAINHNSTTTSSSKWPGNGGWGLAGTKYGEFICATCHEPRATNIKSIKTAVTAPVGTFPGGASSPVNFQSYTTSATDMGNDEGNTPRASSTRVCEVCHTYDLSQGSGVKAHSYTAPALGNHYNADNTDCTTCHKHNKGFDASCIDCHGNPPTTAGAGGPTGLSSPDSTGSTTAGAHLAHVTTLSFACTNCHYGYVMPENKGSNPQTIDIGFNMWTKNGAGTTYGAADQVRVLDAYRGTNSTAIANDNTRNCSNLYCHGAFSGGLTATPTWTGTAACGTCHAYDAASATSLRASHIRHAGNAAGGLSVACADCHGSHVAQDTHVNGSVAWSLNRSDNRFGSSAVYSTGASGFTGAVAPSATYQTCGTLYCHSNVQNGTATDVPNSYGGPRWGDASVTCAQGATGCHGNPPATPTANTAHGTHTSGSYSFITCAACHNNAGDETTLHANGTINMTINTTYGGTYSQGDHTPGSGGYGTCSNVYCHGNFTGGLNASPAWNASIDCTTATCHNYTTATPPTKVNHPRHVGTGAGQLGLVCTDCHPARVSLDGHVDSSVQWALDRTNTKVGLGATYKVAETGATGSKAPSAAYGNCGTVYCHSSVQSNPGTGAPASYATPTWGAASVTCASCHGQGTASASGQPSTGSHEVHVTTYAYTCAVCHSGHGEDVSTHANRLVNITFDGITSGGSASYSGDSTPQTGAFGTCTTTFCHGDSTNTSADTGNWGTSLSASDACTVCHGTKTTGADGSATAYLRAPGGNGTGVDTAGQTGAGDAQVGAHDTHLRSLNNYSSDIACTECHAVPVVSVTGIQSHLDGTPANMTWGTLANANSAPSSWTSPNCTNTYCHFGKSIGLYSPATANASVSWTNTAYLNGTVTLLGDCGKCHQSPPATTGAHNGVTLISECTTCHSHVTAAGTFSDATKHINGAVESTGTCKSCHLNVGGSDTDDYTYGTAPKAMVGETQWLYSGHGKASGPYDKSGNAAANFPGAAGANDPCYYCHIDSVGHNDSANFFRLRTNGYGDLNGACRACHEVGSAGVNPGAGYTLKNGSASVKINKYHYGTVHSGTDGGRWCWDCHDPHGDSTSTAGPIEMIQLKPAMTSSSTDGKPGTFQGTSVVFSDNTIAVGTGGFAMNSGTFAQGICNNCHTQTLQYKTNLGANGHDTTLCTGCHKHDKDSGAAANYGATAFAGDGTCTGCHNIAKGTRRIISGASGEFGLAWGHHNINREAVEDADCVVCHMEGKSVTDPTRSAAHAGTPGGDVNLRDPDTGLDIGTTAAVFARNLGLNTLELFALSIQNNQCLHCHDSDTSAGAGFGGAKWLTTAQTSPGGKSHTRTNPFGYATAPTIIDVYAQFSTANATFHPVRGTQNNSYCDLDTMEIPWNVANGTHKLMTCFDCHAPLNASGNINKTPAAHGAADTVRKPYDAVDDAQTQLCVVCHKVSVYWGTATHNPGNGVSALQSDNPADEWSAGSLYHTMGKATGYYWGCTVCHGGTNDTGGMPARGSRGENVHGTNRLVNGNATWPNTAGNTAQTPPYSFLRNTNTFNDWDHTAKYCNMNGATGCRGTTGVYTPGGTY